MSANPLAHPLASTDLATRYPHLLGQLHTTTIAPEHLCPHCGEAILQQLAPERVLGVYTAEGWWRCPSCNHQCSDNQLKPQTEEQARQSEIDQCRREDERRGQPGGSTNNGKRRSKPLPKKEFNHLQDQSYGGKERIARPTSVVSVRLDDDDSALAQAVADACRVSRSVVIRWALEHGWEGLRKAGWCPPCQSLCTTERCLTCGQDPMGFGVAASEVAGDE